MKALLLILFLSTIVSLIYGYMIINAEKIDDDIEFP